MNTLIRALVIIEGVIGLIVFLSFLLSLPVMLLWDAVMP